MKQKTTGIMNIDDLEFYTEPSPVIEKEKVDSVLFRLAINGVIVVINTNYEEYEYCYKNVGLAAKKLTHLIVEIESNVRT